MFIVTAKMPRRRHMLSLALAALALLAAALLLIGRGTGEGDDAAEPCIETNEARVAYLEGLGWEVAPEPVEALRLTLPETLEEPYRSYNALQAQQGFDLTPYLGETLERYTYTVKNYPAHPRGCQADIYVYDGAVVAGDIVCTGAEGFIATLDYPAAEQDKRSG